MACCIGPGSVPWSTKIDGERDQGVSFPTAMVHSFHWVALSINVSYPEVTVKITTDHHHRKRHQLN